MKTTHSSTIFLSVIIALLLFACAPQKDTPVPVNDTPVPATVVAAVEDQPATSAMAEVEFTLKTIAENGKLLYIGVGRDIDGVINPDLLVPQNAVIRLILINGDAMLHDLFLPDFNAKTEYVKRIGEQTEIVFETGDMQPGSYVYYCTVPGHRKAGQEGKLILTEQ